MNNEEEKQPSATAVSRRLAPGGGGGGAWLGGPKTGSSEKYRNVDSPADAAWGEEEYGRSNLFGDQLTQDTKSKLREYFDFPPFSVLNAREGPWQARKRAWLACGIQSEVGRGENLLKMSDTLLEPDPEKRAEMQAARGLTWGVTDMDQMRHREGTKGDAITYGRGGPGDLAAGFKARAINDRQWQEEVLGHTQSAQESSGTSIFDPVLCELCYRWFCRPGGLILDPFAGGSVRGIVAGLLGYRYYGIDLRPEQIAANEEQRRIIAPEADINWVVGDSSVMLKTAPEADAVFSCPPYFDLEQYSDDPTDLSSMTWEQFVGIYRAIIRRSVERMKPNTFATFVVGEVRDKKTGLYRGFVPLTCASFMAAGAAFYNSAILITSVGSLPIRITKQFESSRKLGTTHQHILCFVKGDPKIAAEAIRGAAGAPAPTPISSRLAAGRPAPAAPDPPLPAPLAGPSALAFAQEPQVDLPRFEVVENSPRSGSLADFLGTAPAREVDWKPEPPPSLDGIDQIVLNFETNGLRWWDRDRPIGVTVGSLDGKLKRFLPFGFRGANNLDEAVVKRWFEQEVRGKHITNANTRFDIHMGHAWGVDFEAQGNTVSDVMHYAALLDDHRKRFALDVLAKDYLGGVEVERVDERNMADYAASEVAPRAEYQVGLVARLRNKMWPLLDAEELQEVRQLEDEVIYPVVEMERNGALLDLELLEKYSTDCTRNYNELVMSISDEVGFGFDHTNKGWQRLFEYCHLPPQESYAEEVVAPIDHHLVQKAFRASQYASLHSKTFGAYKKNIDANGVLRFDINQLRGDEGGTVSGRFSIGYVQQVPNKDNHSSVFGDKLFPRRLYIPENGLFLDADAAQIEYRIFAHFASNSKILAAYTADPWMSFHKFVWEMMKTHKPDMKYTWQKSLNFMKMYGGGLAKLALMMGFINKQQYADIQSDPNNARRWNDPLLKPAVEIQRIYEQLMPEVAPLQARASHVAKSACDQDCTKGGKHAAYIRELHKLYPHRGFVRTLLGRRSRFPNNYKTFRGLNRVISGTAADVNKKKLVELHRERVHTQLKMRLTIHDAVCGDVPDKEHAAYVSEILNRQSFPQLKVPILWQVATGPNWAECKS